jgi:sulfite exporter TauE/SafE
VEIALHLLRIIALALLLFWGVRAVPRSWVERILQRFPTLNKVVDQVIASLSRT